MLRQLTTGIPALNAKFRQFGIAETVIPIKTGCHSRDGSRPIVMHPNPMFEINGAIRQTYWPNINSATPPVLVGTTCWRPNGSQRETLGLDRTAQGPDPLLLALQQHTFQRRTPDTMTKARRDPPTGPEAQRIPLSRYRHSGGVRSRARDDVLAGVSRSRSACGSGRG